MAKDLIVPAMYNPSVETLHSLILLAWAEYGRGRENGLRLYSTVIRLFARPVALLIVGVSLLLRWQPTSDSTTRMPYKLSTSTLTETIFVRLGGMLFYWMSSHHGVSSTLRFTDPLLRNHSHWNPSLPQYPQQYNVVTSIFLPVLGIVDIADDDTLNSLSTAWCSRQATRRDKYQT